MKHHKVLLFIFFPFLILFLMTVFEFRRNSDKIYSTQNNDATLYIQQRFLVWSTRQERVINVANILTKAQRFDWWIQFEKWI